MAWNEWIDLVNVVIRTGASDLAAVLDTKPATDLTTSLVALLSPLVLLLLIGHALSPHLPSSPPWEEPVRLCGWLSMLQHLAFICPFQ